MVNVATGVSGGGQQRTTVFSLSEFILSPPAPPPPSQQHSAAVSQLQLDPLSLQKEGISESETNTAVPSDAPPSMQKMSARATLQCRPNSHPFQDRTLILDSPVKIGRSVARSRPCNQNSIFDCKVLSRNHALLWYKDGKFYLQDTKSSNGTFVNNQRLSKGSEESAPREVCSGDIVQFGVDVMENSRKVTHGCIIATLRLYMPDGQEAKASPSLAVTGLGTESGVEVQHLRTCLQEAQFREAAIQTKLQALSSVIQATQDAAEKSWSAMIGEDRLLQKLEMMEAQLATYAKNWPEDRLREEVRRLQEEKCQYETHVKESLARMLNQKCQALTRLADSERALANTESELAQLRIVAESSQLQLTELLEQQAAQTQQVAALQQQLQNAEEQLKECPTLGDNDESQEQQEKPPLEEELKKLKQELADKTLEGERLMVQVESAAAEADFSKQQLEALQARYSTNQQQQDVDSLYNSSSSLLAGEQKVLNTRLRQYELELKSGQQQLSSIQKDVAAAEKAEERLLEEKRRLEEELSGARSRAEASNTLLHHLQHSISALQNMLHNSIVMQSSINVKKSRLDTTNDDDIVASNNDINTSINDITLISSPDNNNTSIESATSPKNLNNSLNDALISTDVTPKIYEDIYEEFSGTLLKKKDPSKDDEVILKDKDEKPEKNKKEEEAEDSGKEENIKDSEEIIAENGKEVKGQGTDVEAAESNEDDDDEDDIDSVSTEVTITGSLDHVVIPGSEVVLPEGLITSLKQHISKLEELQQTTEAEDAAASAAMAALKEQLANASAAAETATRDIKSLKSSCITAESYSCSRAAVVAELQQSTARLGAAGNIIRQQLQQLNIELTHHRQSMLQERTEKHQLQERLQEAEALAKEGVEQTEALNKQLQQLKVKAMMSAAAAANNSSGTTALQDQQGTATDDLTSNGEDGAAVVKQEEHGEEAVRSINTATLSNDAVQRKSSDGDHEEKGVVENNSVTLVSTGTEGSSVQSNEDEVTRLESRVMELEKEIDELRKGRLLEEDTNRDSGYCDGSNSASTTPTLPPSTPTHQQSNVDGGAIITEPPTDTAEQLREARVQCETLRAKLQAREEDFNVLSLQNKTMLEEHSKLQKQVQEQQPAPVSVEGVAAQGGLLVPLWVALVVPVLVALLYHFILC